MTETRKLSLSAIFVDFATGLTFQLKSNSTSNLNLRSVFNEAPSSRRTVREAAQKIVLIFFPGQISLPGFLERKEA